MSDKKSVIGFSTGCLYYLDIPFDDKIKFYSSLGVNAVELIFDNIESLLEYNVSEKMKKIFWSFGFVSIHAPAIIKHDNSKEKIGLIFDKLRFLCDEINVKGIVLHYDTVDDFEMFDESGLPFLIENMDARKSCGTSVEEFKKLKREYKNLGFVLDLQHAYEYDESMRLAEEFVKIMGERLSHIHISGYVKGELHVPVCVAENKKAIDKILELNIDVPKILEGALYGEYEKLAKKELAHIKKF